MSFPIHSLKWVIILCSLVYPPFLAEILAVVMRKKKRNILNSLNDSTVWVGFLILAYGAPLSILYLDSAYLFSINPAPSFFYILSVMCVPVVIFAEFAVGYCTASIKKRTLARPRLSVHPSWRRVPPHTLILSILLVLEEEMIFRQIWLYTLTNYLYIPWIAAIVISSIVYGLNHMVFGLHSVPQKFAAGLLYGCMYYLSGGSILVTTTMHYTQNLVVGLMGR